MDLSIVDFCFCELGDPRQQSLEVAGVADHLGFKRYWLAEHYSGEYGHSDALMFSLAVAAATSQIRVGPAGVLVRYHLPLQIADRGRLLESLYPGRIDLGLAPARSDSRLQPEIDTGDPLPQKMAEVIGLVRGNANANGALALPLNCGSPRVWVLGSGGQDLIRLAAEHAAHYALSLVHTKDRTPGPDALEQYRQEYRPTTQYPHPLTTIAVSGVCAESEDEAQRLLVHNQVYRTTFCGTPSQCIEQLQELASRYRVDEIAIVNLCRTAAGSIRMLRLLADVFHLQ